MRERFRGGIFTVSVRDTAGWGDGKTGLESRNREGHPSGCSGEVPFGVQGDCLVKFNRQPVCHVQTGESGRLPERPSVETSNPFAKELFGKCFKTVMHGLGQADLAKGVFTVEEEIFLGSKPMVGQHFP